MRKAKETAWLSPTHNAKDLCNFTGLARGLTCALGLVGDAAFTAEDFKSVTREFNGTGKHVGVQDVDEAELTALLARKGVSLQRFKAAMFGNVLTPERFQQLRSDLDEVQRLKDGATAGAAEGEEEEAEKPKPARARAAPALPDAIDVQPAERPRRGSGSRRGAAESPAAAVAAPSGLEEAEEDALEEALREFMRIEDALKKAEETQLIEEINAAHQGSVAALTRGLDLTVAQADKLALAATWDTAALEAILPVGASAPLMEAPSDALLYSRAAGPLGSQPSMPPGWFTPLDSGAALAAAPEALPGPLFRSLSGSLSSGAANKRLVAMHGFVTAHATPAGSEEAIKGAGMDAAEVLRLCEEFEEGTCINEPEAEMFAKLLDRLESFY